jgi:hypothetical protein
MSLLNIDQQSLFHSAKLLSYLIICNEVLFTSKNYVQVLLSIQSLLTDPFCDVCMEPDIGELYLTDKTAFETVAR